jgi:hypothetical protein
VSAPAGARLIGKPGCHLCDEAREVVARSPPSWVESRGAEHPGRPDLQERYWEQIPVTLVDGEPARLLAGLEARLRARLGA